MTVIAWDGKTLAADRRATCGGLIATTTKIKRVRGCLVGSAGDFDAAREVIAWFERGAEAAEFNEHMRNRERWAGLLVINPDGRVQKYESTPYPLDFDGPHFAIGSGREIAVTAMHLGKTAGEAVEIANLLDPGCGNGIDTLRLA